MPKFPRRIASVLGLALALPCAAVDRLDPRDFDTQLAACSDFYGFANGGWLKANPVPAEALRLNRFAELRVAVQQQQLRLLQAVQVQSNDPLDDLLATLARSAGDETSLAAARQAALAALLPAIEQLRHAEQVAELLAAYQARGLPVLALASPGRQTGQLRLDAHLLALPDSAFYLRDDNPTREWLGRYRGYVETLLGLAGSQQVSDDASWAIDFESKLAAASSQSAAASYSLRELDKRQPALAWRALLAGMKLDRSKRIELHGEAQLAELNRLVAAAHPVQWQAWLRFRIAHLLAPYLDAPFRDAHEAFFRVALRGETAPASAEVRVLETVAHLLGDALVQRYVDTHFGNEAQSAANALIDDLRASLRAAIEANDRWQPATRKEALQKLDALEVDFQLPDPRPAFAGLKLDPGTLVGNALALNRWRQQQALRGGARSNPSALLPQLAYIREQNRLLLSPALLQPPLHASASEPALRFGGLGALIAHELVHGFDLGGASFAKDGAPRAWWDEADRAAWQSATAALVGQYGSYAALGETRIDGARTLAENAADLAGLGLAHAAFLRRQSDLALPLQDTLNPAQRFFVAWASLWRENAQEQARADELAQSPASPARFRAIGPLPQLPAFASAFGCKPGDAMLHGAAALRAWP